MADQLPRPEPGHHDPQPSAPDTLDPAAVHHARPEPDIPKAEAAELEPDAAEPEPDAAELEPDAAEPEPDAAEPEPDAAEPEPDAGEPEPDAAEPEPDAAEPEPDAPPRARAPVPSPLPSPGPSDPMPAPRSAETKATISTHVLDAGRGAPQAGVLVRLSRLSPDGRATVLSEPTTDEDGRIASLAPDGLTAGIYRLEFHLDGLGSDFFRSVQLDLRVDDPTRSYHVPLLVAPFGLTTYRGS